MVNLNSFALAVVAVFLCTACTRDALANSADSTKSAAQAAPAGPPKDVLVALERSAYAAWKSKDVKFWDRFLADNFVGWGRSGKLDKVSAKEEYSGADCDIKSYALSEERVSPRGQRAALITYKSSVDGSCGGQRIPANSWVASVYVRDGGQWKAVFHAQDAVVDPALPPVRAGDQSGARQEATARRTAQDAPTAALLPVERAVWEAWKDHDAERMSKLLAENISFINIFGIYLANKAEALKNWSGTGCNVKSVSVTDGVATMLSRKVGILTFKATADGTCFGQKVGPIWGSSIYVKYGDAWKWTFGINVPARGEST
jgi:hypothetical protein